MQAQRPNPIFCAREGAQLVIWIWRWGADGLCLEAKNIMNLNIEQGACRTPFFNFRPDPNGGLINLCIQTGVVGKQHSG